MASSFCTSDVLSLSDELEFWKGLSEKQHIRGSERRRAELFVRLLEPAVKECSRLENSAHTITVSMDKTKPKSPGDKSARADIDPGLAELLDVLDIHVTESLDEIWRCLDPDAAQPFPESRMRQLIEAVGYWIVKIIQMHLGCTEDEKQTRDLAISALWTTDFHRVSIIFVLCHPSYIPLAYSILSHQLVVPGTWLVPTSAVVFWSKRLYIYTIILYYKKYLF